MTLVKSFLSESLPFSYTEQVTTSAIWIAFCPLFWTLFAQIELRTRLLTRLAGGDKYYACYAYGLAVFLFGLYRDYVFHLSLDSQPTAPLLDNELLKAVGAVSFVVGSVFALSSMWALGTTGTYNGDHFGILLKERVTSFPFNVVDNPMYFGSFLAFLGTSLYFAKLMGVFLSMFVWFMYFLALRYEGPHTARIYAKRAAKLSENNNGYRPFKKES